MRLTREEERRIGERPITHVRAYECYQRARQSLWLGTGEGWESAIQSLQQGLDVVGGHPLLHAAMAQAHLVAIEMNREPREKALVAAEKAIERAQARDPRCAYTPLAWMERLASSHTKATRHFEDAVAEEAGNAQSLF